MIYTIDHIKFTWAVHIIARPIEPLPQCKHCNGKGNHRSHFHGGITDENDDMICQYCNGTGYIRWLPPNPPPILVNSIQEILDQRIDENPNIMLHHYYPKPGTMYSI